MSTVPIYFPDGTVRDVPYERMKEALRPENGGKAAVLVRFKDDPSGKPRAVPADKTAEAYQNGGTLVPIEDQPIKHQGFWNSLGEDLKAMIPSANPYGEQELPGRVTAAVQGAEQNKAQESADWQTRKAAGYSAPYRMAAPVAEGLGANVKGMEESAAEGDVGGVYGHAAAVPVAMGATAATEGLVRQVPGAATLAAEHLPIVKHVVRINRGLGAIAEAVEGAAEGAKAEATPNPVNPDLARIVRKSDRPLGPIRGRMDPVAIQQAEALRQPVNDIVDTHVPDQAAALRTKSKIDFHLQRGDVAGAEAALDEAAGKTNPDYQPPSGRTPPANEEEAWKQATQAANEALQQGERRHPELNIDYSGPERRALAAQGPQEYGLNPQPAEDLGNKVREQTEKTMGPIKRAKKVTPEQQAAPLGNIPPRANLPSMYEQTQPPAPYKPVKQIQAEARAVPTSPENLEDHAIQQEMAADLEQHGKSAESEARREFIARNSTGTTKGELTRKARIEKPPAEEEDLTESWTKELERRKRLKGNQPE